MTTEEAINTIKATARCADGGEYNKFCDALDMAISALRAQQTPLDRSRWEGCEWCRKYGFRASVFDRQQFCGRCGTPLIEDAWAELERRIR